MGKQRCKFCWRILQSEGRRTKRPQKPFLIGRNPPWLTCSDAGKSISLQSETIISVWTEIESSSQISLGAGSSAKWLSKSLSLKIYLRTKKLYEFEIASTQLQNTHVRTSISLCKLAQGSSPKGFISRLPISKLHQVLSRAVNHTVPESSSARRNFRPSLHIGPVSL